jgi:hypothetical protein
VITHTRLCDDDEGDINHECKDTLTAIDVPGAIARLRIASGVVAQTASFEVTTEAQQLRIQRDPR